MSNPTSNFNWQMPTNTDLVSQLPADFEVFGQAVDTSLADLKGGTTGQVLKKNTNADMDFVWGTDSAGMTNPMTTTGDTIYSSSGSTPARLGIGSTGQVLTVAAGLPSWATPASGGMTEIASGTLSSTSVLISSIPTTYNSLRLVVRNFKPITDNCNMRMRFNNDSNSNRHLADSSSTGVSTRAFDATFSSISYSADNSAAEGTAVIDIPDYANTTTWKSAFIFSMVNSGTSSTTANAYWNMQGYNQTGAITSLGLLAEGSGFTSGTYILYGVK
jgi:hypothetical protein